MHIIQINMNRCRIAHDLLKATIKKYDTDIGIISEPNKQIAKNNGWYTDDGGDSAIIFTGDILPKCMAKERGIIWEIC